MENRKGSEALTTTLRSAIQALGRGFDVTSDVRLLYCKGAPGSRLVRIEEGKNRDLEMSDGFLLPNVPADIECSLGEPYIDRISVCSFHQMAANFNERSGVKGNIPLGCFNAMFNFTGSWQVDAASTKSLALVGYVIPLYEVKLAKLTLFLRNEIKQAVPSSWDPASLASFIENYGTHIVTSVTIGGRDMVYIRQHQTSPLPVSEIENYVNNMEEHRFHKAETQSITTEPLKYKDKDITVIFRRRGGDDLEQSHARWAETVSAASDIINMTFTPIVSLLEGVPGLRHLSRAIELYLEYKPPMEDLQYFLDFQIARAWAPEQSNLQRKEPVCKSLHFSLMGPKLFISADQVTVGRKPVTGLRLSLEGSKQNRLSIHLQHLVSLPKILQPHWDSHVPIGAPKWQGPEEQDSRWFEPIKWKNFSHVSTSPIEYTETHIGDLSGVHIVTGAQLGVWNFGTKSVLHLKLLFSKVPGCTIRRSVWDHTPVASSGRLDPGGPSTSSSAEEKREDVTGQSGKLAKIVDSSEMLKGPQDLPGHWLVTGAKLGVEKVNALKKIATTLGINGLDLSSGDPCYLGSLKMIPEVAIVSNPELRNNTIDCDCSFNNNTTCRIINIDLKTLGLRGKLPPELAELQYLQTIDLCRNYLSGSIPMEWASLPNLTYISLCANRLSGPLPSGLQNFNNLKFLGVEANQFSGPIPDGIGNLTNLKGLQLGSNQFTGSLPNSLARLVNLEDFRVSDNNFDGTIPAYIGNWSRLQKLYLYASGLKGPIPDEIARLENLTNFLICRFITDTSGINIFPYISSQAIETLILRNVSLSGPIPSYIWNMPKLRILDLSFNNLTGDVHGGRAPAYTYLTRNRLSGEVESGVFLKSNAQIDLSYNNFSWWPSCQENSNINTYRSSYLNNLTGILPCAGPINCTSYQRTLHINCGGDNIVITKSSHKITYQADNTKTKAATNQQFKDWGISNTGEFFSDGHTKETSNTDDTYIISTSLRLSGDSPDIYKTARRSPLSLVYYAFCMENGTYSVKLHFMEIQFSDQELYSRLGRRIFDVYVQGVLFLRDFNIKEAANGTLKPVVKTVSANVTNNILEIQLYWAGKGTTLIPERGNYGPLISAISLCHSSMEPQCGAMKTELHTNYPLIFGVVGSLIAVTLLALGLYTQKICIRDKYTRERDLRAQGLQTVCFTWRQLEAATNNFDQANKLGEGGFGSVLRGELSDGTIIAVKQLSSKSCQGNREFVNEIGMISGLNHPNLVKLYGCCVEKNQLMLVYEYMENNSLALALFGKSSLKLQWEVRQNICVGIARGLEFLHEGSMIRMVHRDIKTSNVLLDADLNAKISDFGLARLHEEEHTHISTKIAGTVICTVGSFD